MPLDNPIGTTGVRANKAMSYALAQVGKPYRWGSTGPNAFDCSGLVQAAFKSAGVKLPRTTGLMRGSGKGVTKRDLQPGDLVFPDAGHVQIYLGGGKVVEAPRTGLKVRVVPMWGFAFARRVTAPGIDIGKANTPVGDLIPLPDALKPLVGVVEAIKWITDAHNLLRVAAFIAGLVVLLIALGQWAKVQEQVTNTLKAAKTTKGAVT